MMIFNNPSHLYIGVPSDFLHDKWEGFSKSEDAMSSILGYPVTFIANSASKLYHGDVYAVRVKSEHDKLQFILTNGFDRVNEEKVKNYVKTNCLNILTMLF